MKVEGIGRGHVGGENVAQSMRGKECWKAYSGPSLFGSFLRPMRLLCWFMPYFIRPYLPKCTL